MKECAQEEEILICKKKLIRMNGWLFYVAFIIIIDKNTLAFTFVIEQIYLHIKIEYTLLCFSSHVQKILVNHSHNIIAVQLLLVFRYKQTHNVLKKQIFATKIKTHKSITVIVSRQHIVITGFDHMNKKEGVKECG